MTSHLRLALTASDVACLSEAWRAARAPGFRRRLEALLGVAQGRRYADIARRLGVSRATIRYWVTCYRKARRIEDLMPPGERDFEPEDRLRLSEALEKVSATRLRRRIEAVLAMAECQSARAAAERTGINLWCVQKWVARYLEAHRVEDLMRGAWEASFSPEDATRLAEALKGITTPELRRRVRAVLSIARGRSVPETARRLRLEASTVYRWMWRYLAAHRVEDVIECVDARELTSEDAVRLACALKTASAPRRRRRLQALLSVAQGQGVSETARRMKVHVSTLFCWLEWYRRAHRIERLGSPAACLKAISADRPAKESIVDSVTPP